MRLNQASDYALRIVMQCAMQPERIHRIEDVVKQHQFSKGHVMKIVSLLTRAEILKAIRGRGGGFCMGENWHSVTIGDVVRVIEADFAVVECLNRDIKADCNCCFLPACRIKPLMRRATDAFMAQLDGMTIQQAIQGLPIPPALQDIQTA